MYYLLDKRLFYLDKNQILELAPEPAPETTPKPAADLTVFDTPKTREAKSKRKKSSLKLHEELVEEISNEVKIYISKCLKIIFCITMLSF